MKYLIEEATLTGIADAIRGKNGTSDLIPVTGLADAIINLPSGGGDLPEEVLNLTGNCRYRFTLNGWNWFIENFGNQITTENINDIQHMFENCSKLKNIPFRINLKSNTAMPSDQIFFCCEVLETVPYVGTLNCIQTGNYSNSVTMANIFYNCYKLKEIPYDWFHILGTDEFWEARKKYNSGDGAIFSGCHSLRTLPDISMFANMNTSSF